MKVWPRRLLSGIKCISSRCSLRRTRYDERGLRRRLQRIRIDRQRPNAIAKEKIQELLWPQTFVSEANLSNLVAVSRVIVRAAQARENSRGAHFRADFPAPGDLDASTFTRIRSGADGELSVEAVPVVFSRVRPGASLI